MAFYSTDVRAVKPVLYNSGGFVAHVAVKLNVSDSFSAFVEAANLAHDWDGRVEALYQDSAYGSRLRIGGVERAGLVLEPGALDDADRLTVALASLREERATVTKGRYAQALDRAIALLDPSEPA